MLVWIGFSDLEFEFLWLLLKLAAPTGRIPLVSDWWDASVRVIPFDSSTWVFY